MEVKPLTCVLWVTVLSLSWEGLRKRGHNQSCGSEVQFTESLDFLLTGEMPEALVSMGGHFCLALMKMCMPISEFHGDQCELSELSF